jgi:hypothetical protein
MPRGRKKGSGKREKAIVAQAHALVGEIRWDIALIQPAKYLFGKVIMKAYLFCAPFSRKRGLKSAAREVELFSMPSQGNQTRFLER